MSTLPTTVLGVWIYWLSPDVMFYYKESGTKITNKSQLSKSDIDTEKMKQGKKEERDTMGGCHS